MMTNPKCYMNNCFANKDGECCVLVDYPSTDPCSFFKTRKQVDAGREDAHKKLVKDGRWDLIKKYEYNRYSRRMK